MIKALQTHIGATPDGTIGPKTLKLFARHYDLNAFEVAHFFGQCHHESGGFRHSEEGLYYSAPRLLQVFKRYFDESTAAAYGGKPQAIANRVYANRMGNGDEASGDGWKYRGRGALQLTGKDNYKAFGQWINKDLLSNPDLVATEYAISSALWYFYLRNVFTQCVDLSDHTILKVSRIINVGNMNTKVIPHHMDLRIKHTKSYYNLITS